VKPHLFRLPLGALLCLCVVALAIPCAVKGQSPTPFIPAPPTAVPGQEGAPPPAPPAGHVPPPPPQFPSGPPAQPQASPFLPGPAQPAGGRPRLFRRLRNRDGQGERPRLRDRFRTLFGG
jgi:hypothetical protein